MALVQKPLTAARTWHAAVAVLGTVALVAQLVLTVLGIDVLIPEGGREPGLAERVVRFFSYFTVQCNILCIVAAASLVLQPGRDGRLWRVLRLDALVGISVTIVVSAIALAPLLNLTGISWLTDVIFHYVMPIVTVVGWLLFGPRPRIDTRTLLWSLVWPTAWTAYILVLGAISGWYPYPFMNVDRFGFLAVLRNSVLVLVLLLAAGFVYRLLDTRLPPREN